MLPAVKGVLKQSANQVPVGSNCQNYTLQHPYVYPHTVRRHIAFVSFCVFVLRMSVLVCVFIRVCVYTYILFFSVFEYLCVCVFCLSAFKSLCVFVFARVYICLCLACARKSRDSSASIALGYGLDDRGCRVRFPAGAGNFSLHHCVQHGSGAHPASYPVSTRVLSLGVKRPGREADHSPPSGAEVKECVELYFHSPIRLHGTEDNLPVRVFVFTRACIFPCVYVFTRFCVCVCGCLSVCLLSVCPYYLPAPYERYWHLRSS
jgi:hypothetical protein